MEIVSQFIIAILTQLYAVTGDLGISIIIFTVLVRSVVMPLTLKSLKSQKQLREIQPELKKLQKKHKGDKEKLQKAQVELYQKYNINPLAGCLPQIVQIVILIFLYHIFINYLGHLESSVDPSFLWLDLTQPDTSYVLPILAAGSQLLFSLMIMPGGEVRDVVPNKSKSKKVQQENEKEEDVADMAASMQKQMMFIMPVMTFFIALRFPAGLALYWVTTTIFSMVQQVFISGWGGLATYPARLRAMLITEK